MTNAAYHAEKKENSIQWAKSLLERKFVIIDFETTGFNGEPVQIGILDSDGNKLMSMLVKPKTYDIEPGAERVHGISDEMVKDAPTFKDVHKELFDLLNGFAVVAYNEKFDKRILFNTCDLYELPAPRTNPVKWFDPMLTYAAFRGNWNEYRKSYRWPKLVHALDDFDFIVEGDAHDAATDCEITLKLIQAMANS